MITLVPNSWGATLRESNDCHEPGGTSKGGQFCGTVKRGWHLTDNPHFVMDPEAKPEWNSLAGDLMGDARPKGMFVTDDPEYWMHAHGYERPYVAEVEGLVTNPPGTVMHKGREEFMQGQGKTVRVLTIDEFAREHFGEPGWVEDYFSEVPPRTKFRNYVGRPVSDMSPAEIKAWEQKFAKYAKRKR
jgi:hypothetical protein